MTLCLSVSAFNSPIPDDGPNPYINRSRNFKDLMKKIGVPDEDVAVNKDFTEKPGPATIGVGIGSKTITLDKETFTLIIIAIRGGGYEAEWVTNFDVGLTGHHEGWANCRDKVLNFLNEYLSNRTTTITGHVKFWLTGFSRAAATANLVAAKIDEGLSISSVTYSPEDVYVYTFNTPSGAVLTDEEKLNPLYFNIFNLINPHDIVPYVAPHQLGFGHYGIDTVLPSFESSTEYPEFFSTFFDIFNSLPSAQGSKYTINDFHMKTLNLSAIKEGKSIIVDASNDPPTESLFLIDALEILGGLAGNRSYYVKHLQTPLEDMLYLANSHTKSSTPYEALSLIAEKALNITATLLKDTSIQDDDDKLRRTASDAIGEQDSVEFTSIISDVVSLIKYLLIPLIRYNLSTLVTVCSHLLLIGISHTPDVALSALAVGDPNYNTLFNKKDIPLFPSTAYRSIVVDGSVDVEVSNSHSQNVCSVSGSSSSASSSVKCGVAGDKKKYIYLPSDDSFSVSLSSSSSTTLNYEIREFSFARFGNIRIVTYNNVSVSPSSSVHSSLPTITTKQEGKDYYLSTTPYTLSSSQGSIPSTLDIANTAYISRDCVITLSSSDTHLGTTSSSVHVPYGEFVTITAQPKKKGHFAGWFSENTLVSAEAEYTFLVLSSTTLTAVFTKTKLSSPSAQSESAVPQQSTSPLSTTAIIVLISVSSTLLLLFVAAAAVLLHRHPHKATQPVQQTTDESSLSLLAEQGSESSSNYI